jgi:hypothetical protein
MDARGWLLQDGVYPEKVNAGRVGANNNMRRIGQNAEPVTVKFSGKMPQVSTILLAHGCMHFWNTK